jgi:murein DD-endopeptidase MepM/ murein hydrolase activator NlpD
LPLIKIAYVGTRLLKSALNAVAVALLTLLREYPRAISGSLAALLLGSGATAFAVASLVPDVSGLPVHQVLESVQALPLAYPADTPQQPAMSLFRSDLTRSSDTADSLLARLGIVDAAAAAFVRGDDYARQFVLGRPGKTVMVEASADSELLRLSSTWPADNDNRFTRLVIEKTARGFASRLEQGTLTASHRLASGTIRSSLFAATDDAHIPDAVATQVAEIFSGDIDFHRALRKGDRFSVVYETLEVDGESLRTGKVLSAEFVNNGKTYQALWFQPPGLDPVTGQAAKGSYYAPDGQSLHRAYLASPVAFSRISSGFSMRLHPILQTWRAHRGVDYAAPLGTPVRSVGDGVVDFAGWQNGYGNVVLVKHHNNQTTVYAHMSKITVRQGQAVDQGQNVGLVGATGWATGPHLHFEFRVNGVYQDPMTVARQSATEPVAAAARPAFERLAGVLRRELREAASVQQASAE